MNNFDYAEYTKIGKRERGPYEFSNRTCLYMFSCFIIVVLVVIYSTLPNHRFGNNAPPLVQSVDFDQGIPGEDLTGQGGMLVNETSQPSTTGGIMPLRINEVKIMNAYQGPTMVYTPDRMCKLNAYSYWQNASLIVDKKVEPDRSHQLKIQLVNGNSKNIPIAIYNNTRGSGCDDTAKIINYAFLVDNTRWHSVSILDGRVVGCKGSLCLPNFYYGMISEDNCELRIRSNANYPANFFMGKWVEISISYINGACNHFVYMNQTM